METRAQSWHVIAASEPGASHERIGHACQDAHAWTRLREAVLIAAVADGAGSTTLGGVGAATASKEAVESAARTLSALPTHLDDDSLRRLLCSAVGETLARLGLEAHARQTPLENLATTLILVVGAPGIVGVAQVGDGVAVAAEKIDDAIALTRPQSGEYVNETTFLTSAHALELMQVAIRPCAPRYLALISDGLQRLALRMPDGAPHVPFFSPLFKFMSEESDEQAMQEKLSAFLRSPKIRDRSDDDLTLLLAALH